MLMLDEIIQQLQENNNLTYWGGKNGYDYICFNNVGKIECSGKRDSMIEHAKKHNLACAILIPVVFSDGTKK